MSSPAKQRCAWVFGPKLDEFIAGSTTVGGLTVQMFFWAQLLIANGWKVSALAGNRQNHHCRIKGIDFFHLPSLRFFSPVAELWMIIKICFFHRPEIIITRGATRSLFALAIFCRLNKIRLTVFFASDSDLIPGRELLGRRWDRWLWRSGLKINDLFVCQNQNQYELLQKNYRKSPQQAVIIPNIWLSETDTGDQERKNILWISNFRKLKHPEMFLELAAAFPEEHFVMAGAPFDRELYRQTEEMAAELGNVELLGKVPFDRANQLFREAKLFVCTSDTEGFPNTFLQAFSNGIPVLTTFDPSGIVEKHKLGMVVNSAMTLIESFAAFSANEKVQVGLSRNAAEYFTQNYSPALALEKLNDLIRSSGMER